LSNALDPVRSTIQRVAEALVVNNRLAPFQLERLRED
jgi:hypothetical protein